MDTASDITEVSLQDYARVLNQLRGGNIDTLAVWLDDEVRFIDPFNDLTGKPAFIGVMTEMFDKLDSVRFEVHEQMQHGLQGWLYWRFSASSRLTGAFSVEGASRIRFSNTGRVVLHHDFWDASLMLQQFPLLGRVIAQIRKRAAFTDQV